jgi:nucleotide sugar dehydrogenase
MRAVQAGFDVVGLDVDKHRVSELAAGRSFVGDVADDELQQALASGRYSPADSYQAVRGFDVAVITVPTPLRDSVPDLSYIEDAAEQLSAFVTAGCTVILESTTYPGTTEELVLPILERGSGLRAGTDFHVGYSPERIDPGNPAYRFGNTPKVVSGLGPGGLERVTAFYAALVDRVVPVSSPKVAELTKLLENTFRHVNIALMNELAIFADQLGIDIWEAIDAASTKPFGYMRFTPGPGVGGHCLPVDPSYLSWQVRRQLGESFRFIELANDINDHMPVYVVQRVTRMLNARSLAVRGSTILLVGLSYKPNTGDIRESPALKVISLLHDQGAELLGVDPHVEPYRWPEHVTPAELSAEVVEQADLAIILTPHAAIDLSVLNSAPVPVLDTQRSFQGPYVETL